MLSIAITQDVKWATYATQTQKSVAICWFDSPVINALDTTLQHVAHIDLRQKQSYSTETRMKKLACNHFICTRNIKSFRRVKSLLFMDNSEPYLPSLITKLNNQYATRSASSYKF